MAGKGNWGKLTEDDKIEIIRKYEEDGLTIEFIAKKIYKVTPSFVTNLLKSRSIELRSHADVIRKYYPNHNYFNLIDTPEKAYFLGFLYADGCNQPEINTVKMALQYPDKYILQTLNDLIQDRPLTSEQKSGNRKLQFKMTICSKQISQDLIQWGCPKDKTFKLVFPEFLDKSLWSHFFRGMWDGDGTVQKLYAGLVGTEAICLRMQEIIRSELNINCCIVEHHSVGIKRLLVSGRRQLLIFLNWMYRDSEIHMERKYNRYLALREAIAEQDRLNEMKAIERERMPPREKQDIKNRNKRLRRIKISTEKDFVVPVDSDGERLRGEDLKAYRQANL